MKNFHWFYKIILFIFLIGEILLFSSNAYSQGSKFKKKVVSYVDKVIVSEGSKLDTQQTEYIRQAVVRSINFERFNYAPLPENIMASFSNEVTSLTNPTPETLQPIIDKTLSPQLLQILDINKELLSRQNLTEEERNTFLATKAKAAGLSAEQLESILNSGFFYVPYIESYAKKIEKKSREVKDEKQKVIGNIPITVYSHSMKLGVLWYKLNIDRANNAKVTFAGMAQGWHGDPIERSGAHDDETLDGKKISDQGVEDFDAFKSAVDVSCLNIPLETKKIEAFKLTGEVTEATAFGVRINLGSKEGVGLDDSYWIEEFEETTSGEVVKNKRGFVKVREVGNNKNEETAESYAQTITGTNYSGGLSVTEIPLLGVNGLISLGAFPVSILTFNNTQNGFLGSSDPYNFGVVVNSETKMAYGAMAAVQVSLAKASKISELWANLSGGIGIISPDGKFYIPTYSSNSTRLGTDSVDIGASLSIYFNVGILKKFYFRRFGLIAEADIKYAMTSLSAKGKDKNNENDVTYELNNSRLGMDIKVGMEMYITPAFSVGGGLEYNMFGTSNSWDASVVDKDKSDITKATGVPGPDVKYSGIAFSFWVNYSLPSFN